MTQYDRTNLFRKILNNEIPCFKIFETEHSIAILDVLPCTKGHSLLIPKCDAINIHDMTPEQCAGFFQDLPRLATIVKNSTGASGVNIVHNAGAAAGQSVFHAHFHVIPRHEGDALLKHPKPMYDHMLKKEEADAVLQSMAAHSKF